MLDNAPGEPMVSTGHFSLPLSLSLSSLPRWSASASLSCTCSCLESADTPAAACRLLLLIGDHFSFSLSFDEVVFPLLSLSLSVPFPLLGQLTSRPSPTRFCSRHNTGALVIYPFNASFSRHSPGHSASDSSRYLI